MVRVLVFGLVVAGCGRLDFGAVSSSDARPLDAASSDGQIPDLAVAYLMDDDPSTGVIHATVAAYDATCTTCPTATTGIHAGGYLFGATDGFELPLISTLLVDASPYTIAVWAKPAVVSSNGAVIAKPFAATTDCDVLNLWVDGIVEPGRVVFETTVSGGPTDFDYLSSPAIDYRGAWHHFAISWDGTTKRLYIDGVFMDMEATTIAASALPLWIGADLDNGMVTSGYIGTLDEVRFYGRALSDQEIAALAVP